jgi:2-oxoglutarate dehydrogenase E2 component (dihydrolipoamide succinyltransferase)
MRAQVLRWLKTVGERVGRNEPLLEVETDKVTVEIPAPAAGVLCEILKHEQASIDPGEVLGRIDTGPAAEELLKARPPAAAHSSVGASDGPARSDIAPAAVATRPSAESHGRVSAPVRRLLQRHHLEAANLQGTGPAGAITIDDVLAAAQGGLKASVEGCAEALAPSSPPEGQTSASRRIPHSATRRRIAEHMVRSLLHTAPHVTSVFEADFSGPLRHRARHREMFQARGAPLTLTAYILAACVDAIHAVPEVNARWHEDALEVFESIDIGVGTAVAGRGLLVPVLHAVQSLDLFGIASGLASRVAAAREGRLSPQDVRGGTFTISNHGVSGSLFAAPIVIHQPQVAILGVGKLEKRPVVIETEDGKEQIAARPRCYLSLTIDHRALDGDRANEFLRVLVQRLEGWPLE